MSGLHFKNTLFAAVCLAALIFSSCAVQTARIYKNCDIDEITGLSKKALIVPVFKISTNYSDKTRSQPDTVFPDSFLIESLNSIILFEAGRYFTPVKYSGTDFNPTAVGPRPYASVLLNDTVNIGIASEVVKKIAGESGAALVIVPYQCEIEHAVVRPRGWRNDKYENTYARPTAYLAKSSFHVQVWSNDGKILFERIGNAAVEKPMLYTMMKKLNERKKNPEKDIIKTATRFYSSPIIKALYKSVQMAFYLN